MSNMPLLRLFAYIYKKEKKMSFVLNFFSFFAYYM